MLSKVYDYWCWIPQVGYFIFEYASWKCADKSTWLRKIFHLMKVGLAVIFSFTALWLPLCLYHAESETCISSLLQVLSRQFPFSRGIFEDKVANLWYSASVLIDFRQHLSIPQMVRISVIFTLLLISPIAVDLMRRKGSPTRFYLSLVNCSMAFFLASFQVSEWVSEWVRIGRRYIPPSFIVLKLS